MGKPLGSSGVLEDSGQMNLGGFKSLTAFTLSFFVDSHNQHPLQPAQYWFAVDARKIKSVP